MSVRIYLGPHRCLFAHPLSFPSLQWNTARQASCPQCYSSKLVTNASDGNTVCMMCGVVVSENALSAEIGFGESSSGAAIVQGSYVSDSATGAKLSRPGARHGNVESREVTIGNGKRACMALALTLNLSPTLAEAAGRWFTLAVQHEFTKGRKSQYVIAACLYIACRQAKNDVMLIDFSDKLQVNVFELGSTYLKLVRKLNIQRIPLIDPSIYIQRFANLLEFGDDTQRVATDAVRLVARFERDWMQTGRRPSGICGACLILAARMNNFRRSIAEVVQVVKIADVTLRKRLQEFQATKSGQLTVQEFRTVWLDEHSEKPPAMIRNLEKESKKKRRRKKGALQEDDNDDDEEAQENGQNEDEENAAEEQPPSKRQKLDRTNPPDNLEEALFADLEEGDEVGRRLENEGEDPTDLAAADTVDPNDPNAAPLEDPLADAAVEEEILEYMGHDRPAILAGEIDRAEQRRLEEIRRKQAEDHDTQDALAGLDEDELDSYLLDDQAVKVKTLIWNKLNHDYMVKLHLKQSKQQGELDGVAGGGGGGTGDKPRRQRGAKLGPAATHEEAIVALAKHKKFSRKINYESLAKLMQDDEQEEPEDEKLRRYDSVGPSGGTQVKVSESQPQQRMARPPPLFDDGKEDEEVDETIDPALGGASGVPVDQDKEEGDEEEAVEVIEEEHDASQAALPPPTHDDDVASDDEEEADEWNRRRAMYQEDHGAEEGYEEV